MRLGTKRFKKIVSRKNELEKFKSRIEAYLFKEDEITQDRPLNEIENKLLEIIDPNFEEENK